MAWINWEGTLKSVIRFLKEKDTWVYLKGSLFLLPVAGMFLVVKIESLSNTISFPDQKWSWNWLNGTHTLCGIN